MARLKSPKKRPACAACRHQRKKCDENCVTAPYFLAEKADEFKSVLKVFGVKNVTKLLQVLAEEDRQQAADSFKWEASMRRKYPVLGPLRRVRELETELQSLKNKPRQVDALPLKTSRNWNLRAASNQLNSSGMTKRNYIGNVVNFVPHNNNNNNNQNFVPMATSISDHEIAQAQKGGNLRDILPSQQFYEVLDYRPFNEQRNGSQNISYPSYCNGTVVQQEQRNTIDQMVTDPAVMQRQQRPVSPFGYFANSSLQGTQSQYGPIGPIPMNHDMSGQRRDLPNSEHNFSGRGN